MAAYIPVTGSFAVFGTRFVSPALGFSLGTFIWNQESVPRLTLYCRLELLVAMVSALASLTVEMEHLLTPKNVVYRSLTIRESTRPLRYTSR